MIIVNATNARNDLYNLIDQTIETSEPIQIAGKRGSAVLVSEEDWRAIQESLYLLGIPGLGESLIKGINTPKDELLEDIGWDLD